MEEGWLPCSYKGRGGAKYALSVSNLADTSAFGAEFQRLTINRNNISFWLVLRVHTTQVLVDEIGEETKASFTQSNDAKQTPPLEVVPDADDMGRRTHYSRHAASKNNPSRRPDAIYEKDSQRPPHPNKRLRGLNTITQASNRRLHARAPLPPSHRLEKHFPDPIFSLQDGALPNDFE